MRPCPGSEPPLVSVDMYSKVVIPIALYGSELWSNLTQTNISAMSRLQHYAAKRIQGLPTSTRSDMAESMVGLNRLPAIIEYRKLMFLHKFMSLPSGSVSRDIFTRKLILFVNERSRIRLGFIPDVCQILFKYELHVLVNNLLSPQHSIPSKLEWKSRVNSVILRKKTYLWDQRMASDSDFLRILQLAIEPAVVYKVCNRSLYRNTMLVIARLWTRPVTLENQVCLKCNNTFQDELVHVICEFPSTLALRNQFTDSLASILMADKILRVIELDSVSQTLRLLGPS